MYNYDVINTLPNDPLSNKKEEEIINELVREYDVEIKRQQENAKKAYKGMMISLVLCVIVFITPNFVANSYNRARITAYPLQERIAALSDSQNTYKLRYDNNLKRFNDIRIIQNKLGAGLDSLYFQIYQDDPIFSNLLYTQSTGPTDTTATGKKLVFGGEIPFTSYHNPLNTTITYVKLQERDTMQDRNLELFKHGIILKQKFIVDSIGEYKSMIETNITENKHSFELMDTLSIRIGALLILIFMVNILVFMQRYYNRLAQYYLSRRNALKLHLLNNNKLGFENVVNLLSPDHIEMKLPNYTGGKQNE